MTSFQLCLITVPLIALFPVVFGVYLFGMINLYQNNDEDTK